MIPKMLKEMERRAKELLDNREKLAVVKADETARNKLIAYYEKEIVEATNGSARISWGEKVLYALVDKKIEIFEKNT